MTAEKLAESQALVVVMTHLKDVVVAMSKKIDENDPRGALIEMTKFGQGIPELDESLMQWAKEMRDMYAQQMKECKQQFDQL